MVVAAARKAAITTTSHNSELHPLAMSGTPIEILLSDGSWAIEVMIVPKCHLAFTSVTRYAMQISTSESQSKHTSSTFTSALTLAVQTLPASTPLTSEPSPSATSPTHAAPINESPLASTSHDIIADENREDTTSQIMSRLEMSIYRKLRSGIETIRSSSIEDGSSSDAIL
ncbi:hypothetical protein COCNU_10G008860 [Cocos nucifera]|uniref:Uncharacterized protein n=1 Tax=Cocos nucifera TaxID=13894 RepID=A0A8K0N8N7_COCNU|nr:hypothetical protein COCNU_10G008860 [Cocos nucifera]